MAMLLLHVTFYALVNELVLELPDDTLFNLKYATISFNLFDWAEISSAPPAITSLDAAFCFLLTGFKWPDNKLLWLILFYIKLNFIYSFAVNTVS